MLLSDEKAIPKEAMLPGALVEAEQRLGLGPACLLKEEAFKALN